MANVSLVDDQGVVLTGPSGDTNGNGMLDIGEAVDLHRQRNRRGRPLLQYRLRHGNRDRLPPGTVVVTVHDQATNSYFGGLAGVELTKSTNGTTTRTCRPEAA